MHLVNPPVLVLCAHGTADPAGQAATAALAQEVADLLPRVRVVPTWVDVQQPQVAEVVADLVTAGERVVVVPALLSYGYHTEVDIAAAVAISPAARASVPLGPDPLLVEALRDRLRDVLPDPSGHALVLAAAGSSRPSAQADVAITAESLGAVLGQPVTIGYGASAEPDLVTAVAEAGGDGRPVALVSHLLAPGRFQQRAESVGAAVVTRPLAGHPAIARLVVQRYRACC